MAGERYRSPGSSTRESSARKKRRHHYVQPSPDPEKEGDSDIDSRSSTVTSSSRSSLPAAGGPTPLTRHGRHHTADAGDDRHRAVSRSSRHTHSHTDRHHHHHRRRHDRKALLPAPDERKKDPGETTVALRETRPEQTLTRRRRAPSSSSLLLSDGEEVYDHRPLSRQTRSRYPAHQQPQQARTATREQGFLMGAAMVIVGLFVCFAEAD